MMDVLTTPMNFEVLREHSALIASCLGFVIVNFVLWRVVRAALRR